MQYVVCSHEPDNWYFSESTDLSEVLLVLAKSNNSSQTIFINLSNQPKTSIESLSVARIAQSQVQADLTAGSGICEIQTNGKKFGEMLKVDLRKYNQLSWALPTSFAQTDLCRVAYNPSTGRIFLPGHGIIGNIKTIKLSEVVDLGPDGRDVYDAFSPTKSTTIYPAFWGYDSDVLSKVLQRSNQYLNPLTAPLPGRHLRDANLLWDRAGTLMLPKELWLTTNRVAGVVLPSPTLSNVWWLARWKSSDAKIRALMEQHLALWFNSTLGLFSMLMQRQETRGAWVKFPKTWYEQLHIIDLDSLSPEQNKILDQLWGQIKSEDLLPFPQICDDDSRKLIDDAFSQVRGLPQLDLLRRMLANEPIISMKTI